MLDKLRSRIVHLGPSLLSVPVKLTPFALKRQVLEQVLSWQFRQALDDGELEFLEGRWLSIHVRDIDLQWFTSVVNGKLVVSQNAQADVSFSADASDLLMIAARKQDRSVWFRRLGCGPLENGIADLCPASCGGAVVPERIPVRHWLCWFSGYHLGGNCSGAVSPCIA